MGVLAFNHFNIRAPRALLEEVKHFYLSVIGLEEGFRPDVPVHGYWLYLEELPVLHLMEWSGIDEPPPCERGYLDHVAFSCADLSGFIKKLDQLGVPYKRRDFASAETRFTQLEVTDPAGNGVELNFAEEEDPQQR
jgi:catechol-2,3-dioxygenase